MRVIAAGNTPTLLADLMLASTSGVQKKKKSNASAYNIPKITNIYSTVINAISQSLAQTDDERNKVEWPPVNAKEGLDFANTILTTLAVRSMIYSHEKYLIFV